MMRHGLATLAVVGLALLPAGALAGRTKTISFIPDPSCQGSKLVKEVEATLEDHLKVKGIKIVTREKRKATILLQYFLLARKDGENVVVQLDGRAFENRSGKLLAESSATSDPHPDDVNGRAAGARQAARILAGELTGSLESSLWAKGRGRQVMVHVTLEGPAVQHGAGVLERLQDELREMNPSKRASSERSLVLVVKTAERMRDLADRIEQAAVGKEALKASWVVQSKSSMILTLRGGS